MDQLINQVLFNQAAACGKLVQPGGVSLFLRSLIGGGKKSGVIGVVDSGHHNSDGIVFSLIQMLGHHAGEIMIPVRHFQHFRAERGAYIRVS